MNNNKTKSNNKNEIINSYYLAHTLERKIEQQIYQLNPSLLTNKKLAKRGLIDGLGSIIKSITGNLDNNDALRYDQAIEKLSDNQIKIKTLVNDQITLLEKSIDTFNKSIQTLANNQLTLTAKILVIDQTVRNIEIENAKTYQYFLIHFSILQITTAYQEIYDILERIEIAISFSKLNTFHNSMIEPTELLEEIKLIKKHLLNKKLPFEPKIENILLFEKTTTIKSYSKKNEIIFILEIPIVESEGYDFYHLYALPVIQNNAFSFILPQSKYLTLNEQSYMLFNEECLQVGSEEYICHENSPIQLKEEDAPCEVQLLSFSKNSSNCQLLPVHISSVKVQKVENNKWIFVSPNNIVTKQKCGNDRENKQLRGTFLIELDINCEVQVGSLQIKSYQSSQNEFKNIELPKLKFNESEYFKDTKISFKPIHINSVNLDELKNVKNALIVQKHDLKSISNTDIYGHYEPHYIWSNLTYLLITAIIIFSAVLYYRKLVTRQQPPTANEAEDVQEVLTVQLPNPEVAPRIFR